MTSFFYRIPVALSILVGTTLVGSAQTFDHQHEDGTVHAGGMCGTAIMNRIDPEQALANTARNNPEVYRQLMAAQKDAVPRPMKVQDDIEIGTPYTFTLYNYDNNNYENLPAELIYKGRKFRIWVHDDVKSLIRLPDMELIARGLDTATNAIPQPGTPVSRNPNKGVLENDENIFGNAPINKIDQSDITDFFILDIKDGIPSGATVGGFFSPVDQLPKTINPASNEMNLLYIDIFELRTPEKALSTIAHEFQHLIHYGRKQNSATLFNEGCSEVASILNGYSDRRDNLYIDLTNIDFFRWSRDREQPGEILKDYTRAMTFVHYLSEQYGEPFLYELAGAKSDSMNRVTEALNKIGRTDMNWRETFKGFAAALHIQNAANAPDPRYGFKFRLTSSSVKTVNHTGNDFPTENTVQLEPYGIVYHLYNRPNAALRMTFTGSGDFTVMAILYPKIGGVPEVRELTKGTEHLLSIYSAYYERVVVAVVSLSEIKQTVNWTVTAAALGVDDGAASRAGLSLAEATPNPVAASAMLRFTTAGSEPVGLNVYNTQGVLVSAILDGVRYETGEHTVTFSTEGLPNGVYVIRLTQGEHTVSRQVVVVK